jgi:REP element-mobilizing transposase RayT
LRHFVVCVASRCEERRGARRGVVRGAAWCAARCGALRRGVGTPLHPLTCTIIALFKCVMAARFGWGGRRVGAGRPRGRRPRVRHLARPPHAASHPVHVTLRAKHVIRSFRRQLVWNLVRRILTNQRKKAYRHAFRILHFTVQHDHLHLVVEGSELRAGVAGFEIAFARRLNAILQRRGPVWDSRYHRRDLKTPGDVRGVLRYVFFNMKKHRIIDADVEAVDPFSSAFLFDGWKNPLVFVETEPWPKPKPRTWLLACGWRRLGLLRYDERVKIAAGPAHGGVTRTGVGLRA